MNRQIAKVTNSPRKLEVLAVALASVAFATSFTFQLLMHLSGTGPGGDNDYFRETAWAASYTVNHFKQIPFWDPYKCGGVPLLADPQSRLLTPFFLLHLAFGPIVATNLELTIHLAIAWAGGYVLGRLLGLGYLAAAVCASVFPSSSWIYLHFAAGHISFVPILYLPWMLSMWLLSAERRQVLWAAAGGLFCAVAFVGSGIYVSYLAAPFLASVAIMMAIVRRQVWPVLALLLMAIFALGFSAVKLVPILALHISRTTASDEIETLGMLAQCLFSRNQDLYRWLDGIQWSFFEYGAYIGPFFAGLAMLGVFTGRRRALPWLAGAAVMLALSLGSPAWWAPWPLLHRLPIYDSVHVPSRFLIIFVMALAPLAGLGAEALCRRGRLWTTVAAVILLAGLADSWMVNRINIFHGTRVQIPGGAAESQQFRQFWSVSDIDTLPIARSNQGALNCYEDRRLIGMDKLGLHATGYNQPGYRGEQYLLGDGSVRLGDWTPNALIFEVDVPSPTTMVVNQNYESGWRLVKGQGEIFSRGGLIGVRLPAGRQQLELAYHNPAFVLGLVITMLTFMAMFMVWRYDIRGYYPPQRQDLFPEASEKRVSGDQGPLNLK